MEKQKYWRTPLLAAALVLGGWLAVRYLGPALLPFGVGFLVARAAEPLVGSLQRRLRLPRWLSAGIGVSSIYLLLILLLGILCRLLWREATAFVQSLPELLQSLGDLFAGIEQKFLSIIDRFPPQIGQIIAQTITESFQNSSGLAEKLYDWLFPFVSGLLKKVPNITLFLLTAILSSFMLSTELPELAALWKEKAPAKWQKRVQTVLQRLKNTFGGWLKAQGKLMIISALVLTCGFLLLGIDYPLLFGMVIALIDALPVLGTGMILIPWALLMFLQGKTVLGVGLMCLYGAAALIRTALEPRLLGRQMGLNPLLTLLSLYAGFHFLGVAGMILFPIGAILLKQFWSYMEANRGD